MRINRQHRFVFISTPKVCTHTIYSILDEHFARGLVRCGFHQNQVPHNYADYFRWTVCRNPFTRAVSLWWSACRLHPQDIYGIRKGCGAHDDFTRFAVWLAQVSPRTRQEEPLLASQSTWLSPVEPVCPVHVENLKDELEALPFWKSGIEIPELNTTAQKLEAQQTEEDQAIQRPHWRELYSDNLAVEAIRNWGGEDFARFGYPTEPEDTL